jgi:hypothetical protein
VTLQRIERGAALHLIRYDHEEDRDEVTPLAALDLEVRLPFEPASAAVVDPLGEATLEWDGDGSTVRLRLRDVPLYAIVILER